MKKQNNFLLKRPVSRPHVAADLGEQPQLIIEHNHRISKLCSRFFKTPAQTYIKLDEQGAFVWAHCTGVYTVGEIIELISERFGPEAEPVLERLIVFIRMLLGKNLIDLQD
jgi:hypothetical protein